MTDWEAIEERFTRLRDFVLVDLEGFASNETGGNFGLLALVVAACDALGALRYGSRAAGDKIFERCLPADWKAVADILFEAIRNGLIHGYDAKLVVDPAGGTQVGFAIGWRGSSRHMQFVNDDRTLLYIDAPTLVGSLRKAFDDVEHELRESRELRDDFFTRDRKDRKLELGEADAERWREAVSQARVSPEPWPPAPGAGATGPIGPS